MRLYVSQAKVRFDEGQITGAELFFNIKEDDKTFDLNGYLPITPEQYINNFQGSDLAKLVRDELIDKLENAEVEYKEEGNTGEDNTEDGSAE